MRILAVIHDYLPLHAAGSEIYTSHLCRALADAGHSVAVFTCEEHRARPQYELIEREHDGLPVFEGVYNRIYHDLSEQWDDPAMAVVFDGVLARWAPDLVLVAGLQFVGGVSLLKAAAARGVRVIMTLHEYWWLCPRAGLMYDGEGRACEQVSSRDCARCVDIYPVDRERWGDARHPGRHDDLGDRRWFARALDARRQELDAARALVHRFIAPSRFLAERMLAHGFDEQELVVCDYGFPAVTRPRRQPRPPGAPLRVAFVGTLSDYKGPLVLARAAELSGLPPERLTVTLHGHLDWFPQVAAELRALESRVPGLTLAGPFAPEQRAEVFAAMDLLVVPSLWWENSPLTIHEAFQHGVPVLTSDRGGMAELVAGGGGLSFPPGDSGALAGLLRRLVSHGDELLALARSIPQVRPIEADAALITELAGCTH